MPEMKTISSEELEHLKERARKLAQDKAHLQLINSLMNKVSAAQGLDSMITTLLSNILDVIGGVNIILYFLIDNDLFSSDVYGKQMKLNHIDDEQVRKAFEFRVPIEYEHDFSDTRLLTPEFTKAYTWVFPLLARHELIGVIKLENLHISMRELYGRQPTFFTYVASVLKNEIHGQTRLKQAYDQLSEMNEKMESEIGERKQIEEELMQARDELEERVAARTAELQNANERMQQELSERERAEQALHTSAEEIHDLYNRAPCGYHSLDGAGIFIRMNDTELQWLGYSREEMIGKMKFSDLITERSVQTFRENFPQLKERGWVRDLDFEMVRKDGSILPVLLNATAVYDDGGNYVMSRSTIYDVTERKKEEEKLTLAKAASPLTGLPGNVSIERVISEKLSSGTRFEIAYIDIDNFKSYNDFYGFQKGDLVIKTLAEIIESVVNHSDVKETSFCGHIGGDDFILITIPYRVEMMATEIIREFEANLEIFHGEHDFQAGVYLAVNRKGVAETFWLLSLSIGILNTLQTPIDSYAQLASTATEVKRSAKRIPGSCIIINKRSK